MQEEELCNSLHSLCIGRLTKFLQSYKECQPILTGLPSLLLHPLMPPLCVSRRQLLPLGSFVQLLLAFPSPISGHVKISRPNLLSAFTPKQTKGSSAWRTTYIVSHFEVGVTGIFVFLFQSNCFLLVFPFIFLFIIVAL